MSQAFGANGNTVALTVGTVSSRAAMQFPGGLSSWTWQCLVTNSGTNTVFVAFGTVGIVAAIPVVGTPANGIAIAPNTTRAFTVQGAQYIAAIAAATGNTLYATAGVGE